MGRPQAVEARVHTPGPVRLRVRHGRVLRYDARHLRSVTSATTRRSAPCGRGRSTVRATWPRAATAARRPSATCSTS
eukprot:9310493-Alexandrium_andersonii.AAC.1